MFENFLKFKPKRFLGVDIGTSFIKIIELKREKTPRLENYGELEIAYPEDKSFRVFEGNSLLLSDQEIAETIQLICREAGIKTKEANFSIPDFSTFSTTFEIPPISKDELPEAVRYEIRPYVPIPLSEITLDWLIIEGEVSKTALKILAVAIPNDIIEQYKEIAKVSQLELQSLEPEVFSLARAFVPQMREKVVGLIDIGARSTVCSVFDKGVLKISYSFNSAGNELTERIAKSLNIDYNKAEELKKQYGILASGNGDANIAADIKKILLPMIDSNIGEINRVFNNFSQKEEKEIEKIILVGGLSFLPGLKDYLKERMAKEIEIGNPFSGIVYPPVLEKTLKTIGPSYAVSVGLALKGFE